MDKKKKIRDLHNFFLNRFKLSKPIKLTFCHLTHRGSYSATNRYHYIFLNKLDNYHTLTDSLIHEWGHVLDVRPHHKEYHSSSWGNAFAKVYRAYLEWDDIINT